MSNKKELASGRWLLELYDGYDGSSYYFDEAGTPITAIHANDASWSREYFDRILKHFGVNGTRRYCHEERPDLLQKAKELYPEDFESEEEEE